MLFRLFARNGGRKIQTVPHAAGNIKNQRQSCFLAPSLSDQQELNDILRGMNFNVEGIMTWQV